MAGVTEGSGVSISTHSTYYLDAQNRSASFAAPTTPTVVVWPTVVTDTSGLYNNSTGVIILPVDGVYNFNFFYNISSGQNRTLYSYVEVWNGSSWVISRYSTRLISVTSTTDGQYIFVSSNYFKANTQLRFSFWASGACNLVTEDAPNTTAGTATIPATRILITGMGEV